MRSLLILAMATTLSTSAWSQTKLPTVKEATELSRRTGRPIFAMAGRKT